MIDVLLVGVAGRRRQIALRAHRGFRIVAVCASGEADLPAAQRVSADLDVPLVGDIDVPGVDLVSIAVPPEQRASTITKCLHAGKHILADAPLAGTLSEVTAIVDAAGDRVLLPAHHHRYNAMLRSARAAVAAGRVGLPWNVQADFLVAGGAPLADNELLVHPVDAVRGLLGLDAVRVHAVSAADFTTLLVDYRNGVTGTIAVGRMREMHDAAPGSLLRHRYRISGSHGTLDVDATRPGLAVRTNTENTTRWLGADTVSALVADLHRAITTGGTPIAPDDVVHTYRILDAAQQSLRTGNPCEIT